MQSGAFLSHGDAAGNLKVFSNRTNILFYKVIVIQAVLGIVIQVVLGIVIQAVVILIRIVIRAVTRYHLKYQKR